MSNESIRLQWIKELVAFKGRLHNNVTKALEAYITANEHDSGEEYWNDEYGFDARGAFRNFIQFLEEWQNHEVDIDGIIS